MERGKLVISCQILKDLGDFAERFININDICLCGVFSFFEYRSDTLLHSDEVVSTCPATCRDNCLIAADNFDSGVGDVSFMCCLMEDANSVALRDAIV